MQNNYDNQEVQYAGFWVRLAAYIIDSVIVFAGLLIVRLILAGVMSALKGTVLGGNILFHYNLKDIVLYLCEVCYFILFTYYTGTTIGKKAMNLRVVCAGDEKKTGLLTVVYRETVGRFLSGIVLCIGYLMIGIDREKRGLHDILCDTRVIYAKKIKVIKVEQPFIKEAFENTEKTEDERDSGYTLGMPWEAPYTGTERRENPYADITDRQTQQSSGYRLTKPEEDKAASEETGETERDS